jgi:putative endonuclease
MLSLLYRIADQLRHRARLRHMNADLAAGRRGEDLAHRFLRLKGFTIIGRNYRPRAGAGEIDLIARDNDQLVFVEVKTRATAEFGTPDRAVDLEKQGHLERTAREYARRAGVAIEEARFDIVSIVLTTPPAIELIPDAFRTKRTL